MPFDYDPWQLPDALNFPVESVPASEVLKEGFTMPPNAMVTRRPDTNYIFDVTSDRRVTPAYTEAMQGFQDLVLNSEINAQDVEITHKFSDDKAQWWMRINFPQERIEPQVGDVMRYGLDFHTSLNRTLGFGVSSVAFRLECLNGMVSGDATYSSYRKHTSTLSIEGEMAKLANGIRAFYDLEAEYKRWNSVGVTTDQVEELFRNTFARYFVSRMPKTNQKALETMMGLYHKERRTLGNTAWAVYNAATAWATHTDPKRGGNPVSGQMRRDQEVSKMLNNYYWKDMVK